MVGVYRRKVNVCVSKFVYERMCVSIDGHV